MRNDKQGREKLNNFHGEQQHISIPVRPSLTLPGNVCQYADALRDALKTKSAHPNYVRVRTHE